MLSNSNENFRTPRELALKISESAAADNELSSAIQSQFKNNNDFTVFLEDYFFKNLPVFREYQSKNNANKSYENVIENSLVFGKDLRIGDNITFNINVKENLLQELKSDLLKSVTYNLRNFQFPEKTHDYIQLPIQTRLKDVKPFSKVEKRNYVPKNITDTPIQEVFSSFNGEMLVLGSPGSGKTTLLYELGNSLAAEAKFYPDKPVPVVFNLSSWTRRIPYKRKKSSGEYESVLEWLLLELSNQYGVKEKAALELIEKNELVFLLDGLDEVQESSRKNCVKELNSFRKQYKAQMAVCSRRIEYDLVKEGDFGQILRLEAAVELLPIEENKVLHYLEANKLDSLIETYNSSNEFKLLLQTPLWLYIASRAYKHSDWEGQQDWKYLLMSQYEDWLLEEKKEEEDLKREVESSKIRSYSVDEVVQWTAWLAYVLDREKQTIFYLERMQFDFLPNQKIKKYILLDVIIGALFFGFVILLTKVEVSLSIIAALSMMLISLMERILGKVLSNRLRALKK